MLGPIVTRGTLKSEAETDVEKVSMGDSVAPPCAAIAGDDVEAGTGKTVSVTVALLSPQVPATDWTTVTRDVWVRYAVTVVPPTVTVAAPVSVATSVVVSDAVGVTVAVAVTTTVTVWAEGAPTV